MNKNWFKISLFFFLIVAFIGTSLRAAFFVELPFNYKNLVHAHSHVAFQGWIYSILFLLISHFWFDSKEIKNKKYPLQFKATIIVIVGVLISFSLQGYGLYSIIFSTLFQFLNYWLIFSFFKSFKTIKNQTLSIKFIKTGLWLGILSTLFPWAIGITAAKGLNGTEIYHSLIYGFLHFQYNGWFMFIAIGLFFKCLEIKQIQYHKKWGNHFYLFFTIAIIPAISLSLLGMSYDNYIKPITYASATIKLIGIFYFFLSIKNIIKPWFKLNNHWINLFFSVFLASFFFKNILQILSCIPPITTIAFFKKDIVIAYLHLCLLGVLSFFLIGVLFYIKWLSNKLINQIANTLITCGFITSEALLVARSFGLYNNNILLFGASAFIVFGILILLVSKKTTLF